jgi:hypothetical protein
VKPPEEAESDAAKSGGFARIARAAGVFAAGALSATFAGDLLLDPILHATLGRKPRCEQVDALAKRLTLERWDYVVKALEDGDGARFFLFADTNAKQWELFFSRGLRSNVACRIGRGAHLIRLRDQ